jgi:hypothetical protein
VRAESGLVTLGAKAVENGGRRYGAMESALRPPLPTATDPANTNPTFFAAC